MSNDNFDSHNLFAAFVFAAENDLKSPVAAVITHIHNQLAG